jgi:hypothetical protein
MTWNRATCAPWQTSSNGSVTFRLDNNQRPILSSMEVEGETVNEATVMAIIAYHFGAERLERVNTIETTVPLEVAEVILAVRRGGSGLRLDLSAIADAFRLPR